MVLSNLREVFFFFFLFFLRKKIEKKKKIHSNNTIEQYFSGISQVLIWFHGFNHRTESLLTYKEGHILTRSVKHGERYEIDLSWVRLLQSLNLASCIYYAAYIKKLNEWCEARWEYSTSIKDIYSMCDEA